MQTSARSPHTLRWYRMLCGGSRLPFPKKLLASRRKGRHTIHKTEKNSL